jgi:hypothetical protein
MTEYKCVKGHDRCDQMYPCKECPYCERIPRKKRKRSPASALKDKP